MPNTLCSSHAPPCCSAGQPSELSGDPFKAPAIKQEQLDEPTAAAAGTSPAAAAAAGAGPKRFSDDTSAGPDVAASPATGWAEVYGGDVEDEAAAADAAAAAADGGSSPAAAAGAEGAAAGGVEGLAAQADGAIPFFFMDAYEAPERPGVWSRCGKEHMQGCACHDGGYWVFGKDACVMGCRKF